MPLVKSMFGVQPVGAVALVSGSRIATFSLLEAVPKIPTSKAIISGFSWQDGVNVQFTHTMGNDIYMNVFGNRMGTLTIHGIAFTSVTKPGAAGCDLNPEHGIKKIIDYYQKNRVSTNPLPILVKVGAKTSVSGYLVSAGYSTNDTQNWMVNYQLQVATIPRS